jgi:hypothetical protein
MFSVFGCEEKVKKMEKVPLNSSYRLLKMILAASVWLKPDHSWLKPKGFFKAG